MYDETMARKAVHDYRLPKLPPEATEGRTLVLFRFKDDTIILSPAVSLEDAQAYASRDDTHGEEWFVGYW